jgi:hypothetical protein
MNRDHLAENRDRCRSSERDAAKTKRPPADLINKLSVT